MPPSSDDLPGRTKPVPKRTRSSGRTRGKQKGAKGSALGWVSIPDERVPHRPEGRCGCGADLARAADVGIERSPQGHDLPEVHLRVSQHDVYRVRCDRGAEHVGSLPAKVSAAPSSYGVNLQSLVVYLLIYQHVPGQRCVQVIAELWGGAGPSEGFGHGMLSRCAAAVGEVVVMIKTLITAAWVVGFDETTPRAGSAGEKKYVLSASTQKASVYYLGGRDLDSFAEAASCPPSPGWPCTTATATTSIPAGSTSPGTSGLCRSSVTRPRRRGRGLPRRAWAGPGATRSARPDPRLAHRPQGQPGRDRRGCPRPADQRVPPRHPCRPGAGAASGRATPPHRTAPRRGPTGVPPRP